MWPAIGQIGFVTVSRREFTTEEFPLDQAPALLETVARFSGPWEYTWHTYPTPTYYIGLYDRNGVHLCVIHLTGNTLGSDCGVARRTWPPMSQPSPEAAARLRELIEKNYRGRRENVETTGQNP